MPVRTSVIPAEAGIYGCGNGHILILDNNSVYFSNYLLNRSKLVVLRFIFISIIIFLNYIYGKAA